MFNSFSKGSILPLAVLIILIVLFGGFFAYKYLKPAGTLAPEQVFVQENNANWKTYTNEKYSYELKYPEDWGEQKPGDPPYPGPPEGVEFYSLDNNNFCRAAIESSVFSFDGEIENLRTKEYTENSLKIGGIEAIQFISTDFNATPIFIYFEHQGIFYRIARGWGATDEIDKKCLSVFNGMISSFKLMEKSSLEQACLDSGGQLGEMLCCKSGNDFPNMCLIGSCGCHPDDSHYAKICDCGYGKCFDGNTCVLQ